MEGTATRGLTLSNAPQSPAAPRCSVTTPPSYILPPFISFFFPLHLFFFFFSSSCRQRCLTAHRPNLRPTGALFLSLLLPSFPSFSPKLFLLPIFPSPFPPLLHSLFPSILLNLFPISSSYPLFPSFSLRFPHPFSYHSPIPSLIPSPHLFPPFL